MTSCRLYSIASLFFISIMLPPLSTLFPYTTLFRSETAHGGHSLISAQPHLDQGDAHSDKAHGQDLKSTRLNSSHGYISYAVFCLKKKKKDVYLTRILLHFDDAHMCTKRIRAFGRII